MTRRRLGKPSARPVIAGFLVWTALAGLVGAQEPPSEFRRLVDEASRLERECQPRDPGCLVKLADAQRRTGQLAAAEQVLARALTAEPRHVPALLILARVHRTRFRFQPAFELAEQVRGVAPGDREGRLLAAHLSLDRMDYAAARASYEGLLRDNPRDPAALCGVAEVHYWENRFTDAEKLLGACLEADPRFARAWLLKSLIHRSRQENAEWAAAGRKAVEADPLDDEARANLSNILMRGEQKAAEGYAEARLALLFNPYSYAAHTLIGNGWTSRTYPEIQLPGEGERRQRLLEALDHGNALLIGQRLEAADEAFDQALRAAPGHVPALIGKGAVRYARRDYEGALDWFFRALTIDPDYGLAHYGVSMSLLRQRDAINVRLPEIERRFAGKDAAEPAALRDVFTGYATLDPEMQKIVRVSVQPLRAFLPLLKERKGSFAIFPFHHFLWQVPANAKLRGTRTFDGRLWDDVKGVGGLNASSGAEWERDVKYLRFNVLTHEFTHQVHRVLPADLRKELEALYAVASKTGKTLDFYSQANVQEYFAVGVEAYVSEDKLADQKITYGHTRRELQERDPELYAFIKKLDEAPAPGLAPGGLDPR